MTKRDHIEPEVADMAPGAIFEVPAAEPLASDLALREHQLTALRAAMTMTCWAGVCDELPAAREWFDAEGNLL
jgi:hypothetical protein